MKYFFARCQARIDQVDTTFTGLPFQSEVNTGFGILAKTYIDATIAFSEGGIKAGDEEKPESINAKDEAMRIVEETFTNVKSPRMEVERGFRFWDSVSRSCSSRPSTRILGGLLD